MTETAFTPHPGSRLDAVAAAAMHEAPVPVAAPEPDTSPGYVVATRSDMPEECVPRTQVLSAANPYLLLLPRDMRRRRVIITAVDGPVILADNKDLASNPANALAGAPVPVGAWVPQGVPYPLESRDQVWAVLPGAGNGTQAVTGQSSQQVTGSVTSPAAGQVIAQVTGLAAGLYQVQWTISIGGTTSGTEADNFALNVGATQELVSMNGSGSGTVAIQATVNVQVPANGSVNVTAIATGTVSSVYRAQIVVTPLQLAYASCRIAVITERYAENP